MISIRPLLESELRKMIELKISCWTEELAGKAKNTMSLASELEFWAKWMHTGEKNDDIRLLIGAFENNQMLGVAIGSFAETSDIPEKGIELNGLWVQQASRGRGISLLLMKHLLEYYSDMERIVIYNHHYAPSNDFYLKFGAKVSKQVYQMSKKLLIDVFTADISTMKSNIEVSLSRYDN
jgi:GNAT superfamily N-acetyltransferase